MRATPSGTAAVRGVVGAAACAVLAGALVLDAHAGQNRTLTDGVYSELQAARGRQTYGARCVTCHGDRLEGAVGPPLAGDSFLSVWSARPLSDLVGKIEKTMPPEEAGSVSPAEALDLAAYVLQSGRFPAGQADLTATALGEIRFPASQAAPAQAGSPATADFAVAANLAQLMRAVTFPNANALFNVQVRDPADEKPVVPVPFDYVKWGATVYYGWQAVDQAALTIIETSTLFLLPGRRCENGRPVPVDRPDWRAYTLALVEVGRDAYRASQSRNVDAVAAIADRLNDACANCHKVYRDGAAEGATAGAARCR